MTRRQAVIRVVGGVLTALLVWTVSDLVVPDGYTHARHAARALIVGAGVGACWVLITRVTTGVRQWQPADGRRLLTGAAGYLLPAGVAAAVVLATGAASLAPAVGTGELAGQAALVLVLVVLFEAVPEELVFRDLLQGSLTRLTGPVVALLAQAALFVGWAFAIGAARTPDRIALMAVFALLQGVLRHVGGSVLVTVGFHAAFQWVTQWITGGSWNGWRVEDPDLWLLGAFTLAPLLLAVPVVLLTRPRPTGTSAPRPEPAVPRG